MNKNCGTTGPILPLRTSLATYWALCGIRLCPPHCCTNCGRSSASPSMPSCAAAHFGVEVVEQRISLLRWRVIGCTVRWGRSGWAPSAIGTMMRKMEPCIVLSPVSGKTGSGGERHQPTMVPVMPQFIFIFRGIQQVLISTYKYVQIFNLINQLQYELCMVWIQLVAPIRVGLLSPWDLHECHCSAVDSISLSQLGLPVGLRPVNSGTW